jgi:hypothetical protein
LTKRISNTLTNLVCTYFKNTFSVVSEIQPWIPMSLTEVDHMWTSMYWSEYIFLFKQLKVKWNTMESQV